MGAVFGWAIICAILYGIFNAAIGSTAGWIAVGVWTVISLLGFFGELEHRKRVGQRYLMEHGDEWERHLMEQGE